MNNNLYNAAHDALEIMYEFHFEDGQVTFGAGENYFHEALTNLRTALDALSEQE